MANRSAFFICGVQNDRKKMVIPAEDLHILSKYTVPK